MGCWGPMVGPWAPIPQVIPTTSPSFMKDPIMCYPSTNAPGLLLVYCAQIPAERFFCMEIYYPPEVFIALENRPSQKESSLPTIIFQGRAVKLQGCMPKMMAYPHLLAWIQEQNVLFPNRDASHRITTLNRTHRIHV